MALQLTRKHAAVWEAHKAAHVKRSDVHQCAIPPEEKEEIKEDIRNRVGINKISKKTGRNGATISPIYTAMVLAGEL